jgi:hypothetical protein
VDDAPKASDDMDYDSGFIDDFGRYSETNAKQCESLQRGTIPELSHTGR